MDSFFDLLVAVALVSLGFGLVSRLAAQSIVTAPMVAVVAGALTCPHALNLLQADMGDTPIQIFAEVTLVLILFSDASRIDARRAIRERAMPFRLLAIGLPLTMLLGTLVAKPLFPGLGWVELALLACVLAPTDAALGQAVVSSPQVPEPIRDSINIESGLNDGIALPPILALVVALGAEAATGFDAKHWTAFAALQLIVGPLAGTAIGWGGGRLIERASAAGWMQPTFQRLAAPSLAIVAYAGAELVEGNGFIAAFFAGLFLGVRNETIRERMEEFGEAEGQQLALIVFFVFGLSAVPETFPYWDLQAFAYAVASLTVIRMLPVALSLAGSGADRQTVGFIGWFGPRGIASVLYILIVVGEIGFAGHERVASVVTLTVLLSVFAHGLTAVPFSRAYGKHVVPDA